MGPIINKSVVHRAPRQPGFCASPETMVVKQLAGIFGRRFSKGKDVLEGWGGECLATVIERFRLFFSMLDRSFVARLLVKASEASLPGDFSHFGGYQGYQTSWVSKAWDCCFPTGRIGKSSGLVICSSLVGSIKHNSAI
jgi:hypothetical protein